jgi:hypothetical protein
MDTIAVPGLRTWVPVLYPQQSQINQQILPSPVPRAMRQDIVPQHVQPKMASLRHQIAASFRWQPVLRGPVVHQQPQAAPGLVDWYQRHNQSLKFLSVNVHLLVRVMRVAQQNVWKEMPFLWAITTSVFIPVVRHRSADLKIQRQKLPPLPILQPWPTT